MDSELIGGLYLFQVVITYLTYRLYRIQTKRVALLRQQAQELTEIKIGTIESFTKPLLRHIRGLQDMLDHDPVHAAPGGSELSDILDRLTDIRHRVEDLHSTHGHFRMLYDLVPDADREEPRT